MDAGKQKTTSVAKSTKANQPFFSKDREGSFFGESVHKESSFFKPSSQIESSLNTSKGNGTPLPANTKAQMENSFGTDFSNVRLHTDNKAVQKQEEREPKDITQQPPSPGPANKPLRVGSCMANPEFPDFGCFATQLKLNVDENLINNAHQFLRIASLYPDDSELMWNTFMRYGMGVNLLQTSFRFLGTDKKWSNILSYGSGIGMKAYQFTQTGELKLDFQIPLKKNLNLNIKFDLNADPNDPTKIKGVDTGIGISGPF